MKTPEELAEDWRKSLPQLPESNKMIVHYYHDTSDAFLAGFKAGERRGLERASKLANVLLRIARATNRGMNHENDEINEVSRDAYEEYRALAEESGEAE